eukprot:6205629-Pleurochrysis_carterae.AAC.3
MWQRACRFLGLCVSARLEVRCERGGLTGGVVELWREDGEVAQPSQEGGGQRRAHVGSVAQQRRDAAGAAVLRRHEQRRARVAARRHGRLTHNSQREASADESADSH